MKLNNLLLNQIVVNTLNVFKPRAQILTVCGNKSGMLSLLHKVFRQGYYWPNMVKDAK